MAFEELERKLKKIVKLLKELELKVNEINGLCVFIRKHVTNGLLTGGNMIITS